MRPPHERAKAALTPIMLIAGLALLSACTAEDRQQPDDPQVTELVTPSPTTTFNDFQGFVEEYRDSAERLTDSLPEGAEFPEVPSGAWETGGNFEEGSGDVSVALEWRCAWATEYVIAADAEMSPDARAALGRLADWSELAEVRDHTDEETRAKWLERVVEPARVGDDEMLRAIQVDCTIAR